MLNSVVLNLKQSKIFWVGLLFVTMIVTILWHIPALASTPKHYTELTFPPLSAIQLPPYERYQLDNGITVYLIEDHELPLVGGTALFRTGDRFEPADKVGLASMTAEVMRNGGTRQHSADELNQLLEQKAASVEAGIYTTSGRVGFGGLSEDLETVFGLFTDLIRNPAFPQDKLDLAKTQTKGAIARRNDDPEGIASREFVKLIYGQDSPYARSAEYSTLDNINREDLVDFYQQYFHPETMILGIVGDFEPQKMKALIAEKLGDWKPSQKVVIPPLPAVSQAHFGGVFFVDQPQLTQSYVEMGHLGGLLNDPNYPELTVMNEVLDGFGGRLFNNVRSRQGLAYSVYGYWGASYDYPGMFNAGGQTRSEATVPFITGVKTEIERLQKEPIKPEELAYAKESTLNSFIFNFEDPAQTLWRLMQYEYYGYPKDFIFDYQRQVQATTIEDVQRVAQQYLKPENLVILVVGNQAVINPPLKSLNDQSNVTTIDVTIPGS
ncbi:Processing proteinase [Planktothrix serta PCC 8927]|uniref:Processing proteinase n=1 Tax=Planktothrix serta PCC 8927 TaxID=671068 RepID=A0A7Z9BS26_9CYAN|nr:pitrilysin family protein [Planktothrix serta]VXD21179.1 Processing proteinase [Planktothrix serta PCC 8927]